MYSIIIDQDLIGTQLDALLKQATTLKTCEIPMCIQKIFLKRDKLISLKTL